MSLNLTKKEPTLQKIMVGLGWEMRPGVALDLDVSVFLLASNGKLVNESYFVFYNNLKTPDNSVQHTGDNRTGDGEGDDEVILVNLTAVAPEVTEILFVATIHEASTRNHSFGLLKEAYIRLVNVESKLEIVRYDLDAEFGTYTGVEFAKFNKINNEWNFTAIGIAEKASLETYVNKYI